MYSKLFRCALISALLTSLFATITVALAAQESIDGASECKKPLSLEDFRALAFQKSPLIAEIDAEYAGELANAFEREVLRNPELNAEQVYTHARVYGDRDPQSQVALSQPLRLSNFGSRERVADLMRKAGDQQKRAKLLELSQTLKLRFYTLHALQQVESVLKEAEEVATRKVSLLQESVKKGLLSEGDEKIFEGEKYRLQAERRGVEAAISLVQGELSRSVGVLCLITTSVTGTMKDIPTEQALIERARSSDISESGRLDLMAALSKEQSRLEELDAFPEFAPRVTYQHTNDGGDFFGAGIAIPLSIFNRNQGERLRATAAQAASEARQRLLMGGGLEHQITTLRNAAVRSKEQSDIFSGKVVPAYQAALRSQERLYSVGRGTIMEMWQVFKLSNEVKVQSANLLLDSIKARSQLSMLIGEEV